MPFGADRREGLKPSAFKLPMGIGSFRVAFSYGRNFSLPGTLFWHIALPIDALHFGSELLCKLTRWQWFSLDL
jgi:hypothetical protein